MHLVAEIIFIFLIVYLTGSSSKMSKYRFFAFCPVNESNAHPLGQDLEKYISPNVDPGHSGTCASELVTSAYGCKPCSAECFLSDLIA